MIKPERQDGLSMLVMNSTGLPWIWQHQAASLAPF
jgi:hypothetical protein